MEWYGTPPLLLLLFLLLLLLLLIHPPGKPPLHPCLETASVTGRRLASFLNHKHKLDMACLSHGTTRGGGGEPLNGNAWQGVDARGGQASAYICSTHTPPVKLQPGNVNKHPPRFPPKPQKNDISICLWRRGSCQLPRDRSYTVYTELQICVRDVAAPWLHAVSSSDPGTPTRKAAAPPPPEEARGREDEREREKDALPISLTDTR
ncbi:hypothetical protein M406DRAFT_74913 [Cryphonectria parasitica EP155]|uniref:Uncharacterized protein n=1 Tax=Cryphonectria parasitica (strain ATCC 38755 / EP155) TaxID=660469 RepID=A0A9P4XW91_CRYP1|nr:uncharacterized protein M406DRAFT_74913 [Cryphonectria parasitica EP155]KAF3761996.1 hypothetical protein M406DRAFT_74913 [Cryphonectria parasitica EP155]